MSDIDTDAIGNVAGGNQGKGQNPVVAAQLASKVMGQKKKKKGGGFSGGSKSDYKNQAELERHLSELRTQEYANQRWIDVQADAIGDGRKWKALQDRANPSSRVSGNDGSQQFDGRREPRITAEEIGEVGKALGTGLKLGAKGLARLSKRAAGAAKSRIDSRRGGPSDSGSSLPPLDSDFSPLGASDDASSGGFSSKESEDFWNKLGEDTGLPSSTPKPTFEDNW